VTSGPPTTGARTATVTLETRLVDTNCLFGVGESGDGVIRIPRRLVESMNWQPGTRLRVSIITLEEHGRPPRALVVERAARGVEERS